MSTMTQIEDLIKSSSNDLEALEGILDGVKDSMEDLRKEYESGTKSVDDYNSSMLKLQRVYDQVIDAQEECIKQQKAEAEAIEKQKAKIKEYQTTYGRLGSEANTALGIIAAGISKTNPMIAVAIGSVQKLIPNIAECAKMFTKVGLQAMQAGKTITTVGKLLKVAMSPTGIMLVVTAVTSLITALSNLNKKHKEAEQAARDHAEAEKQAAIDSRKEWASFEEQINAIIYGQEYAARKLAEDTISSVGGTDYYNKYVKTITEQYKAGQISLEEANRQFQNQTRGLSEETVKAYQSLYKLDLQEYKKYIDEKKKTASDSSKDAIDYDALQSKMAETTIQVLESLDSMMDKWDGERKKKIKEQIEEFKAFWAETAEGKDLSYRKNRDSIIGNLNLSADETENEEENAEYERAKSKADAEKAIYDTRIENYKSFLDTYSSLSNTITDIISKNLDAELQAGKISESEYKRKKRLLQAFSIASIVASTASGIVDVWKAYASEKVGNSTAANATGPAAPATLAALNAKSLTSAILQTATISAAGAAGIASVRSESLGSSTPTAVSTPSPTINYVSNPSFQESADAAKATADNTSATADNTAQSNVVPVLVVETLDKVQKHMTSVQTNSTF